MLSSLVTGFNTCVVAVLSGVLCILVAYRKARKPKGFPDGPPTKAFVGNLDLCRGNKQMHLTLFELQKKYGKMYSFQMGWYPAIVIACPKLLREAFIGQADKFSNRANHMVFNRLLGVNKGIVMTHGDTWKASRRLAIRTLKDLGLGKSSLEADIQDEARVLVSEIMKKRAEPFQIDIIFAKTTCNIICSMLFGKRYPHNNKEFITLVGNLDEVFKIGSQFQPFRFIPYEIPFNLFDRTFLKFMRIFRDFDTYLRKEIKEHRQTFDSEHIRDFVDVYLEAEKQNSGEKAYVEQNIFKTMLDLYFAGTETTSTTLKWAMLFMLHYPEVQTKCRDEIYKVLGKDKTPSTSDQSKMTYVTATIYEVLRISNIANTAVFHCTNGPVELQGYTFPDKTVIIPDLYSIHMDPETWDNPEEFRPERFINTQGEVFKPEAFLPFSLGKRICAGENLAKVELFIFFTTLLQKFELKCQDISRLPTHRDGLLGFTVGPSSFDIIAEPM